MPSVFLDLSVETGDNRDISNVTDSFKMEDIENSETVYREEISGAEFIRYVYKVEPVQKNVTLASAIDAGTFEDKGKMDSISDCVKSCGESSDCNIAFMLSSQCFNVHCFSDDTCKTKSAYSSFYNPELAYIKHRVIRKPRNSSMYFYSKVSYCEEIYVIMYLWEQCLVSQQ